MSFKATLFEVCQQALYITREEIEQGCSDLAKEDNITEIAWAFHDNDFIDEEKTQPKEPHFHIMVRTNKVTTSNHIKSFFKHNGKALGDERVQKSKYGSYCKMVQYLTHKNDPTKTQYNYDSDVIKVKGNIDVFYNTDLDIITKTRLPYYAIDWTFEKKSYSQQFLEINDMDFGSSQVGQTNKIKCFNQLEKLYNAHIKSIQLKGVNRNMEVIYITGQPGAGKTVVAKFLANTFGYDICVSSSSNDPLQDYQGQKCLIIDDFRQSDWQLSDLLKLLDNHTSSSVKSRYNNKYMNDCKMIILTSVFPITNNSYQKYNNEPLTQLYRRVKSYVIVTEDNYTVFEKLDKYGNPCGSTMQCPNPVKEFGNDGANLFFNTMQKLLQPKIEQMTMALEDTNQPKK